MGMHCTAAKQECLNLGLAGLLPSAATSVSRCLSLHGHTRKELQKLQ